jgi:hypothetical protein
MTGELEEVEQDGYTFKFALDAELTVPEIKEIKATKNYDGVEVVGKVDAMAGGIVDDHKTASRFVPDSYTNSVQWKIYLDIFEGQMFRYNVFTRRQTDVGLITVTALDVFPLYRYPALGDDVRRIVNEYAEFAEQYGVYRQEAA